MNDKLSLIVFITFLVLRSVDVNAAGNTYYKLPEEIGGFVDVADSCEYGISINDEYFIKENCSDIEGELNSLKGKYSDKYILSILSIYDDTVIIYLDYKKKKLCSQMMIWLSKYCFYISYEYDMFNFLKIAGVHLAKILHFNLCCQYISEY